MKDIQLILQEQRAFFNQGKTKEISFRKEQLRVLKQAIQENEEKILRALKADLNKASFEAYVTEVGIVLEEISYMLKHLNQFARPKRVKTPIAHFPSVTRVYQDPYGVVLIMSPWNYPLQLTLAPLIGAIGAGNCSVIKPSQYAAHTSALICELIDRYFDPAYITVVEGGRAVNQSLLKQRFDYIFFTGSVSVGRLVMEEAAKHLTPVTLELGGKSPCIVSKTADVALAARRIVWGKFLNSGQTCVAPDYILIHSSVKEQFIKEVRLNIQGFYGEQPHLNPDFPKIINEKHFERLLGLMAGESIAIGGQVNRETRQIAPTLLEPVSWEAPVMQEEIFGPILPLLDYENIQEIIPLINERPKPLALYCFTASKEEESLILSQVSFGGGCINDTIVHLATSQAGFGGVGESGMGSYHGKASFDTFSHSKTILKKGSLDVPLRYPPFNAANLKLLKKLMK